MIKVLIIDDQQSIINGLAEILINNGFFVASAFSVEEAYPLINNENYDFIISDLKLPGQSGIELAIELQKKNYSAKIFLISAYFTLEDALSAFKANVCDMFPKPFKTKDIINRIKELYSENNANSYFNNILKESSDYKFIKGIDSFFHAGNFYSDSKLLWKYFFCNSNNNKLKGVVAFDISDEEWGGLVNLTEFWDEQKFNFEIIKKHIEKSSSLNSILNNNKSVFFIEIDKINKAISFIQFGIFSMFIVGVDNKKLTLQEFNSTKTLEYILPDNWILIFPSVSKQNTDNKLKVFENEIFLNELWIEMSEKQIFELLKHFSISTIKSPFICFYSFPVNESLDKKINLKINPTKHSWKQIESFFTFSFEMLGIAPKQKIKLTCLVAEFISIFMKSQHASSFDISILLEKNKKIQLIIDDECLANECLKVIDDFQNGKEQENLLSDNNFYFSEFEKIIFNNERLFTYGVVLDE